MAKTTEIGTYTPEQSKMILDVVRHLKQSGYLLKSGNKGRMTAPAATPVYIKNVSGETLPAFGCCQVTGTVEDGGQNYLLVDKPVDANGDAGWYVANLFEDVANGEFGIANDGPMVRVLGATVPAERYDPDPGSWTTVQSDDGLFIAAGPDDIDTNVGKAFITSAGEGSGYDINFEIIEVSGSADIESSGDADDCANRDYDAPLEALVLVTRRPCGVSRVPQETDAMTVVVYDLEGSWLADREIQDLVGKTGRAKLMLDEGESGSADDVCKWMVTFIDWWRWRVVMTDIEWIAGVPNKIYERHLVWDHCKLPPVPMDVFECPTTSSSSGS